MPETHSPLLCLKVPESPIHPIPMNNSPPPIFFPSGENAPSPPPRSSTIALHRRATTRHPHPPQNPSSSRGSRPATSSAPSVHLLRHQSPTSPTHHRASASHRSPIPCSTAISISHLPVPLLFLRRAPDPTRRHTSPLATVLFVNPSKPTATCQATHPWPPVATGPLHPDQKAPPPSVSPCLGRSSLSSTSTTPSPSPSWRSINDHAVGSSPVAHRRNRLIRGLLHCPTILGSTEPPLRLHDREDSRKEGTPRRYSTVPSRTLNYANMLALCCYPGIRHAANQARAVTSSTALLLPSPGNLARS